MRAMIGRGGRGDHRPKEPPAPALSCWSRSADLAVPELQHRGLPLVAERAQRRRIEREEPAVARVEPEPARGQHPQQMPVREEQHVAVSRAHLLDHAVGPRPDLLGRLAVRRAVTEDRPARSLLTDLGRRLPLVVAVVPLHQVVPRLRDVAEPRHAAGLRGPLQRAGEDERERAPPQCLPDALRLAAAFLRQRDVRATRVAERLAPLRLPVPDEHDLLRHAADLDRSRLAERRGGKASNVDARPRPRQLLAALAAAGLATAGFGAADRVAAAPGDTTTDTTTMTSGTTTTPTTATTSTPSTTTHSTTTRPTTTRPTTTRHTTPSTTTQTTGTTSTGITLPPATTTAPNPGHHRRHRHPILVAAPAGGSGHVPAWLI